MNEANTDEKRAQFESRCRREAAASSYRSSRRRGSLTGSPSRAWCRAKENYREDERGLPREKSPTLSGKPIRAKPRAPRNMRPKSSSSPAPTPVPLSIFSATSWARSRHRKSCSSPSRTAAKSIEATARAKPGTLGDRPEGRPRTPIQSKRVLPACCRRRPSS